MTRNLMTMLDRDLVTPLGAMIRDWVPFENLLPRTDWWPSANAYRTKDHSRYVVEVAVPGMTADNITIHVRETNNQNFLDIEGATEREAEGNYSCHEYQRRAFKRTFSIPQDVTGEPEAEVKNGMLTVSWLTQPMAPPDKPKKISVKDS